MTIPLNRIQPHRPMLRCGLSGGDILKYSQTLPLGFVGKGNSAMAGFSPSREKRKRRVVVCELWTQLPSCNHFWTTLNDHPSRVG